jgi:predicted AAA+ superfamily ATPase
MSLLEATFLIELLPAWFGNIGKRLTKAPKLHLVDSGLLGHLLEATAERLASGPEALGPLFEGFVFQEISKQTAWSETRPKRFYARTVTGQEVDIVLEDGRGRIAGIEVKAGSAVTPSDFKHLRSLEEAFGVRFARGVVLYTGTETLPFGPKMLAMPLSALWQ